MVTVGGTESEEQLPVREERSRGIVLVVGALVAGLLLGVLFTGNGPGEEAASPGTAVGEPDATPTTNPPTTTTTIEVVPSRLATMVPGMLDVLVVGGVNRNSSQVVTKWEPAGRAPTVEPLPWGHFVADSSATWLASVTLNRWVTGSTLWVGNTAHMEPVTSTLAGGPVWHTRFPGQLAWLGPTPEAGRNLMTAQFVAGQTATPRAVVEVDVQTNLVGWTSAGFLTARYGPGSGELELRDTAGEIQATREIATGPVAVGRNLIFAPDVDGTQVLLDHNLETVAAAPWDADCHRAAWGPNGLQVSLLCGLGDNQRFEYWQDPLALTVPQFVRTGEEFTDIGFTTNGTPYVVTIESLRPASTIIFFVSSGGEAYEVAYPGLVNWLATLRS